MALLGNLEAFKLPLHTSDMSCLAKGLTGLSGSHIHLTASSDSLFSALGGLNYTVTLARDYFPTAADVYILTFSLSLLLNFFHVPTNTQGVYFLLMEKNTPNEVEIILHTFWSHKTYNVKAIINDTIYEMYFPDCSVKFALKISSCRSYTSNWSPKDFKKCPITINWVQKKPYFIESTPMDGSEYLLLKLLGDSIKRNITWIKEQFRGNRENGTWVGALGNLHDIAAGGFIMTPNIYHNFKLTYPHFYDSYKWYTPISDSIKLSARIEPLSYLVPLLFFIYTCIFFCTMSGDDKLYNSPSLCALNVLRLSLGQPIRKTPKNTHMRILFISWVLFQMNMSSVYSGHLTQKFATSYKFSSQLNTLERYTCVSSNMEIDVKPSLQIKTCDLSGTVKRMAKQKNFSLLASEEEMNYLIKKDKLPIQSHSKQYISGYSTFVLPKYSILHEVIDKKLKQIFESGIHIKLRNEIMRRYLKETSDDKTEEINILLMIYLVMAGWGLSTLTFLWEILNHQFEKKFKTSFLRWIFLLR